MLLCHLLKVIWLSNRFPSCSPNAFSKSSLFIPSTWRPFIPSRYLTTLPLDTISHYWHLVCCHIHTWGWTAWPWARPGPPWRWSACQCRCLGSEGCRALPKRVEVISTTLKACLGVLPVLLILGLRSTPISAIPLLREYSHKSAVVLLRVLPY